LSHNAHPSINIGIKEPDWVILINFVGSARCGLLGLGDAGARLCGQVPTMNDAQRPSKFRELETV